MSVDDGGRTNTIPNATRDHRFRRLRRMLTFLVVLYVAWLATLFVVQGSLLFPRGFVAGREGPIDRAGAETWWLDTDQGRVPAWFVPARDAPTAAPTLVMLHGNAMLIDDWWAEAQQWSADGWNVLLPEFRGYGHAEGAPSEARIVADVIAFIDRAAADERVDAGAICFYGRSIGGAVAAQVALQRTPAALVLRTTPASIATMAWKYGAPPLIVRNPFRTARALASLGDTPILLIGHDDDEIVASGHIDRLSVAAPHAETLRVPGTHNWVDAASETLIEDRTRAFLGAAAHNE